MKIVPYDTLIPDVTGIQPGIAWLLAIVPGMLPTEVTRNKVTGVLENLQLNYANLHGKILQLESEVQEYAEGDVIVALSDNENRTLPSDQDLEVAEEALRTALAEVIVQRGEQRLEKERQDKNRKFCGLYGGDATKLVHSTSVNVKWRFTAEDVERWKEMYETMAGCGPTPPASEGPVFGGTSIQEAIRRTQEKNAEAGALKAVTAAVAARGQEIEECGPIGEECHGCDGPEVPNIDLDGQLLD